jgi:hypothetical protein
MPRQAGSCLSCQTLAVMPTLRAALRGPSGVSLLFVALGSLAAAKYYAAEVPRTETISGVVATSELKSKNYRRQWIEFTLQGNDTEFVYDHPFSDVKKMSSELRRGAQVSMEVARSHTIELWALSLNGRKHVSTEDVLELHREKGWAGVAVAAVALVVFSCLWSRSAKPERRRENDC